MSDEPKRSAVDVGTELHLKIEALYNSVRPDRATGEDLDRIAETVGLSDEVRATARLARDEGRERDSAAILLFGSLPTAVAASLNEGQRQLDAFRDEITALTALTENAPPMIYMSNRVMAEDLEVYTNPPYYPAPPSKIQSDLLAMVVAVAADAGPTPPNVVALPAASYRQMAKAANFGIPNGMGAAKLLMFGDAAQEYVEIAITREEFLDRVRRVGEHEWVGGAVEGKRHNRHDRRRAFLRRDPLVQIAADAIECGRRAVAIGVLAECVALERAIALTTPRRQLAWITPTYVDETIDALAAGVTPIRQYTTIEDVERDFGGRSAAYETAAAAWVGVKQQPIRANHVALVDNFAGNHQTWGPLPPAPNCRCYVAPRYELPAGHALRFLSRWAGTRAIVAAAV